MSKAALLLLAIGLFQAMNARAEAPRDLVDSDNPSAWEGKFTLNTAIKHSGNSSFELNGPYQSLPNPNEICSLRMIPVDMDKTYELSAYLRTMDEQLPASAYMGLRMYDKNKMPINIQNVHAYPFTEAKLTADADKGMNELRMAANPNCLQISSQTQVAVAFNVLGNYGDLPNFEISPQVEKIVDEGATYRVILKSPLLKSYPSGTQIRLHSPWNAPFHWVASGWMPSEWKKFTAVLHGEALHGIPDDQFWHGTKYVRIFVWFGCYGNIPKEGARLLVDDIRFVCGEKNFMQERALESSFINPKIMQEYDKQWRFHADASDEGVAAGWMNTVFPDQAWPLIDADRWWQEQGYPRYYGVAWYRKLIDPQRVDKGSRLFLRFGAVDGDAVIYLNGRKVGEHNLLPDGVGWDKPFYFDITDFLLADKTNMMAVRVKKDSHMCGIFKGVQIISANKAIIQSH